MIANAVSKDSIIGGGRDPVSSRPSSILAFAVCAPDWPEQ